MIIDKNFACYLLRVNAIGAIHLVVVPLRGRRNEKLEEGACHDERHEVHDKLVLVHELLLNCLRQVPHRVEEQQTHLHYAKPEN